MRCVQTAASRTAAFILQGKFWIKNYDESFVKLRFFMGVRRSARIHYTEALAERHKRVLQMRSISRREHYSGYS
jgi:hypothetical protein